MNKSKIYKRLINCNDEELEILSKVFEEEIEIISVPWNETKTLWADKKIIKHEKYTFLSYSEPRNRNLNCLDCNHLRDCEAMYGRIGIDKEDCRSILGTPYCMASRELIIDDCNKYNTHTKEEGII